MYFFTFHCKPVKPEDAAEYGGAYINCWIEEPDIDTAGKQARDHIENIPWYILDLEDGYEVKAKDYANKTDGKEYFEQALRHKSVIVIHTYPIGTGEEEE